METEPNDPEFPLLTLPNGTPTVITTPEQLASYQQKLAAGTGPIAIDAERASGYRYSQRAYLIQLNRKGAEIGLIDPIAVPDLSGLVPVLDEAEWIIHAATQDLPCLNELGLFPKRLFDTEHASRLLGIPKVGLASLVELVTQTRLAKEHSAVDWSTRPLLTSWLDYAALDVAVLIEIKEYLASELIKHGKQDWAEQEFQNLLTFRPEKRTEPWRRTKNINKLKKTTDLAILRELWHFRDHLAESKDLPPGKVLPDLKLIELTLSKPTKISELRQLKYFYKLKEDAELWLTRIQKGITCDTADLPTLRAKNTGPPAPKNWSDKKPLAAFRLELAKQQLQEKAAELNLPVENLLTPATARSLIWESEQPSLAEIEEFLANSGARAWQIQQTSPLFFAVFNTEFVPEVTNHE